MLFWGEIVGEIWIEEIVKSFIKTAQVKLFWLLECAVIWSSISLHPVTAPNFSSDFPDRQNFVTTQMMPLSECGVADIVGRPNFYQKEPSAELQRPLLYSMCTLSDKTREMTERFQMRNMVPSLTPHSTQCSPEYYIAIVAVLRMFQGGKVPFTFSRSLATDLHYFLTERDFPRLKIEGNTEEPETALPYTPIYSNLLI